MRWDRGVRSSGSGSFKRSIHPRQHAKAGTRSVGDSLCIGKNRDFRTIGGPSRHAMKKNLKHRNPHLSRANEACETHRVPPGRSSPTSRGDDALGSAPAGEPSSRASECQGPQVCEGDEPARRPSASPASSRALGSVIPPIRRVRAARRHEPPPAFVRRALFFLGFVGSPTDPGSGPVRDEPRPVPNHEKRRCPVSQAAA